MSDVVPRKRRGLRWIELFVVILLIAVGVVLVLPIVKNTRAGIKSYTCPDNLRQWGQILSMYGRENIYFPMPHGFEDFGQSDKAPNCRNVEDAYDFAPDLRLLYPNYMDDLLILACPDKGQVDPAQMLGRLILRPARLNDAAFGIAEGSGCEIEGEITRGDASYTYLGYMLDRSEDSDAQISEVYAREHGLPATGPAQLVGLLAMADPGNGLSIPEIQANRSMTYPLQTSIPKLTGKPFASVYGTGSVLISPICYDFETLGLRITGAEPVFKEYHPTTAIMWDTIGLDSSGNAVFAHNSPPGANVLFMDGHVEFIAYPGKFPVSQAVVGMRRVQ